MRRRRLWNIVGRLWELEIGNFYFIFDHEIVESANDDVPGNHKMKISRETCRETKFFSRSSMSSQLGEFWSEELIN